MYLLILGLVLGLMKWLALGPVAEWPWWVVLTPFGLAIVWWWWADNTGYTQRRIEERIEARRQRRIDDDRERLGLKVPGKRK